MENSWADVKFPTNTLTECAGEEAPLHVAALDLV